MFNVPFKNPLEAETVSQRRERKAKESGGPIRNPTSGSGARLGSERGGSIAKITIFGTAKAATTRVVVATVSNGRDKAAAKQHVDGVADEDDVDVDSDRSELAGSPVLVTSPSFIPVSHVRQLSELSTSPSVYRQEAVASAPRRPAKGPPPAVDGPLERLQQWGERRSHVYAANSGRHSYASPGEPSRPASPVRLEQTSASQATKYRPERSDPASRVFAPGKLARIEPQISRRPLRLELEHVYNGSGEIGHDLST